MPKIGLRSRMLSPMESLLGGGNKDNDIHHTKAIDVDDVFGAPSATDPVVVHRESCVRHLVVARKRREYAACLPLFLLWTAIFVAILMQQIDPAKNFELKEGIKETIVDNERENVNDPGNPISFMKVEKPLDVYDYLESVLVPELYAERDDGKNLTLFTHTVLRENYLIGGWRIILRRVKEGECPSSPRFAKFAPKCYGELREDSETHEPYGGDDDQEFRYETDRYGVRGFYINFGHVKEDALKQVERLKSADFIDKATRSVAIHFTIYNRNYNMFLAAELEWRIGEGGYVSKRSELSALNLEPYNEAGGRKGLEVVWVLLLAVFTVVEVALLLRTLLRERKVAAVATFWTGVRVTHLLLCFAAVGLWFAYTSCPELLELQLPDATAETRVTTDEFIDLTPVVEAWDAYARVVAILALFFLVRVLELAQISDKVSFLTKTFAVAWPKLWPFMLLFMFVFCFYAWIGMIIFGADISGFKTFKESLVASFSISTGELGFSALAASAPPLITGLYYYTFMSPGGTAREDQGAGWTDHGRRRQAQVRAVWLGQVPSEP
jgi:hypothetical protein